MELAALTAAAQTYLDKLCGEIDNRRTGSPGNRAATAFFEEKLAAAGFTVRRDVFDCIDWREQGVDLRVGAATFPAQSSPYALGCDVQAPLVSVTTVAELETAAIEGAIVLLHGEIAQSQIMPKNFPFYNPEEHQHIIGLLEARPPAAIIAATTQDPGMAGSLSPFPMFEDGDFDIPSVYMHADDGQRLAACVGQTIQLVSRAKRIPATGYNVSGQRGADAPRVVCMAHIDAKMGAPGAIDNAAGVIVLLLLAALLADYDGPLSVEIVAINGEDYFSNPGERAFLAHNSDRFDEIMLGINIDGAGYHKGRVAYSLYDCPDTIAALVHTAFADTTPFVEGEQWYQGDHVMLLLNERPALALTSEYVAELLTDIVHTPQDQPGIVDMEQLARAALALHWLIQGLGTIAGA